MTKTMIFLFASLIAVSITEVQNGIKQKSLYSTQFYSAFAKQIVDTHKEHLISQKENIELFIKLATETLDKKIVSITCTPIFGTLKKIDPFFMNLNQETLSWSTLFKRVTTMKILGVTPKNLLSSLQKNKLLLSEIPRNQQEITEEEVTKLIKEKFKNLHDLIYLGLIEFGLLLTEIQK